MVGGEKSGTAAPQPQTQLDIPLRAHGAGAEGGSPPQRPWFCPSCYSWFKDESITWDKAVLPSNTLGRVSEQGLGGTGMPWEHGLFKHHKSQQIRTLAWKLPGAATMLAG